MIPSRPVQAQPSSKGNRGSFPRSSTLLAILCSTGLEMCSSVLCLSTVPTVTHGPHRVSVRAGCIASQEQSHSPNRMRNHDSLGNQGIVNRK